MLDGLEDASIEMDEAKVCFQNLINTLYFSLGFKWASKVPGKRQHMHSYVTLFLARGRSHHAKVSTLLGLALEHIGDDNAAS